MKWISRLFGFDRAPRCRLQHYKEAGFPLPENMKEVFRFGQTDSKGYLSNSVIFECSGCGTRAYMHGGPFPHQRVIDAVDEFMEHKIGAEALIEKLEKYGYSSLAR